MMVYGYNCYNIVWLHLINNYFCNIRRYHGLDAKGVSPMYKNKKGRMHEKMKYSILIEDIVVSSAKYCELEL